eukprot:scaffold29537_cov125-Isochrysis_galbana.AAC.2
MSRDIAIASGKWSCSAERVNELSHTSSELSRDWCPLSKSHSQRELKYLLTDLIELGSSKCRQVPSPPPSPLTPPAAACAASLPPLPPLVLPPSRAKEDLRAAPEVARPDRVPSMLPDASAAKGNRMPGVDLTMPETSRRSRNSSSVPHH